MEIAHRSVEAVATKMAATAQYGGGGAAFYFGMTANEIAALGGLLIGMVGLAVNIYYKHKHFKLAERRHVQERPPTGAPGEYADE